MLLGGHKFDLRLYALVSKCDCHLWGSDGPGAWARGVQARCDVRRCGQVLSLSPMRVFLCREGLTRVCGAAAGGVLCGGLF
jgi:hypothetical protein